jgi:genome maintenance exonuclease 1
MKNQFWSENPLPCYFGKPTGRNGMKGIEDQRGNFQPGVTPIIDETRSPAQKAIFRNWQKKQTSESREVVNLACQIGKRGHKQIEYYLNSDPTPCPVILKRHWEHLEPVLNDIHSIRLLEGYVFHHYEGYAGRVDCVGRLNGSPESVIEFKFSNSAQPTVYPEQKLQVAAYMGALNRQYGQPYGVNINHGIIITATPYEVDITLIGDQEVMEYWDNWKVRVGQFWSQQRNIA